MEFLLWILIVGFSLATKSGSKQIETSANWPDFNYHYSEDTNPIQENSFQFHSKTKWGKVFLIYLDEYKLGSIGYKPEQA